MKAVENELQRKKMLAVSEIDHIDSTVLSSIGPLPISCMQVSRFLGGIFVGQQFLYKDLNRDLVID